MQAFFAGVKRETRDLKGSLREPLEITAAYAQESAELKALKEERDNLIHTAREALEREANEKNQSADDAKKKISDADVNKKVDAEHPGRRAKLNDRIKELERRSRLHAPQIEAVFSGDNTPVTRVLLGGELSRPGWEVKPGFVQAMLPLSKRGPDCQTAASQVANSPSGFTKRRSELARWLTSADHPLTARVMVNRLWQHHFGVGLVATASDFGRNGERPTHPELLDWLAREFVRQGWDLKKMHRLLMTSAAYRRSSTNDAVASKQDPANKLVWRMNRRRLESEAIRDTILAVSGSLNPEVGGPGVYAKLPKGINVEFPNNDKELSWGTSTAADDHRRSIYLFQRRTLTYPLMEVFDAAPMNQSCAVRPQTTVAPQTLALFNGEFTREAASEFARRLERETTRRGDWTDELCESVTDTQIERAFQIAFARLPTNDERKSIREFLAQQAVKRSGSASPARAALIDFCHVILNANELIYPD
jgi:hypothetical protein